MGAFRLGRELEELTVDTKERERQVVLKEYSSPSLTIYGKVADLTEKPIAGKDAGAKSNSDVYRKENFGAVDPADVLERVANLQIATWNYRDQPDSIRHIGPMAQEFAALFGVGENDRSIHAVDSAGVALAAIQALYAMVRERDHELERLRSEVERLKSEWDAAGSDRLN